MKKNYLLFLLFTTFSVRLLAQCDLGNYMAAFRIPPASYPYTNAANITVNAAVVNITNLANFTYGCGGNTFNGSSPAWWINAANASITLTFSQPVCNFTVLVNGTNTTEEFYFTPNNGTVQLQNFCPNDYVLTGGGASLLCTVVGGASGTIISVDNPAGATQYVLTHNGLAAGSRVTLLDCYVGCNPVPPANQIDCTLPVLSYCVGENAIVNYVATGTFNAGNIFTAELSDPFGNFAAPTPIGSVAAVGSGSILCVIPPGALNGTGYRVRVVSTNPAVIGSNNGTNISIHQLPSVVANATPASVCIGGSLTLNGSGAATYVWNAGILNGVSFVPPATATYTVTGTDLYNCTNTATVTVPVYPLPVITASAQPLGPICEGTSCTLNGGGALTYIWTNPVINNVAFTPPTTATYTVIGTDANNCTNTSTIQIVVNPLPIITIVASPNDTICAGNSVTLTASGAPSLSWSGGIVNGVPFVPPTSAVYTVIGMDANNCSNSTFQQIIVAPLPVVNLGPDVDICEGDQVVLDASTNGATYLWQNGNINPTITATQSGLYWVTVSVNNCVDSDSIIVSVNPYPIVDLGPDQKFCDGATVLLDAFCPGCSYLWSNNSTQASININQEGPYSVTVSNKGCATFDSIYLDQVPLPNVNLGADTTICKGESFKLDAFQFGASYLWQDHSKQSFITVKDIGLYRVEITLDGCTNSDEMLVTNSDKCECPLFVPNAFSPNGDLLNDEFRLINNRDISLQQFSVYNRWGQEVFSSENDKVGWEGNFKGVPCEVGTYYYVVRYTCLYSGKEYIIKGDVTLVR
ncbi:MAG: gliding motility-associated C-terminal domain-containing protein [Bacteroidetes bacterium]|nr:gliding motility-associated C-terminal domain-containing protein [Bacteroidota bacterium]MBP6314966.1 gliding motility-associated C-terminal domain-containing protein [Chitinophagaceae bacterium]